MARLCSQKSLATGKKNPNFIETCLTALPSFSSRSGFGMGFFVRDSRGPSSGSLLMLDGTLRSKREKEHHDFCHKFFSLHFCSLWKLTHKNPKQISTLYNVAAIQAEALTPSCGKHCFSGNESNSFHQQSDQYHLPQLSSSL